MIKFEKEQFKKVFFLFEKNFKLGNIEGMINDDIKLYDLIYLGVKNEKFQYIINNFCEQIIWFRIIYFKEIYRKNENFLKEYKEIVEVIISGDVEKVQKIVEEYIKNQEIEFINSLKF